MVTHSKMPEDIRTIMHRHCVTVGQLAVATERSIETVENWRHGKYSAPVYIASTIEAVGKRLKPVSHDAMYAHRLTDVLGVPPETEWTWRYNGTFPVAARLAIALVEQGKARDQLTPHERQIIRNVVSAGVYYRRAGGWRARPIMGKQPPDMKAATPSDLIRRGYLQHTSDRLTATEKGKNEAYGK